MLKFGLALTTLALVAVGGISPPPAHGACPANHIRQYNLETRSSDCLAAPRAVDQRRKVLNQKQELRRLELLRRQRGRIRDAKAFQGNVRSRQEARSAKQSARNPGR